MPDVPDKNLDGEEIVDNAAFAAALQAAVQQQK